MGFLRRRQELEETNDELFDDNNDYYDDDFNSEADNSRWELDTSKELDDYGHYLLGEEKNSQTGKWERVDYLKAKMNRSGAHILITRLKAVMHKGTYLANIDDNYAKKQTRFETKAFMILLRNNVKDWEVDKSSVPTVILDYARNVYMALSRPVKDLERKHRNARMRMNFNENINEKPKQYPDGLLN